MGFRRLSARPRHHAQAETAIEDRFFQKTAKPRGDLGPADARDQDRLLVPGRGLIGQKNKITRRWAKRGTRPVALQDQRTR